MNFEHGFMYLTGTIAVLVFKIDIFFIFFHLLALIKEYLNHKILTTVNQTNLFWLKNHSKSKN